MYPMTTYSFHHLKFLCMSFDTKDKLLLRFLRYARYKMNQMSKVTFLVIFQNFMAREPLTMLLWARTQPELWLKCPLILKI